MKRTPVTINDIAELAGVSKATVSRVIATPEKVKESTREKVLRVIEENGFVPNYAAQSLAAGKTNTIGIIVDEIWNSFFMEIIEGVDSVVSSFGYSLMIFSSKWQDEKEKSDVMTLINRRADGVILAPISEENGSISKLKSSGVPFVLINYRPEDADIDYVSFDNRAGGRMVADAVNRMDKEQVILIKGYSHQTLDERVEGFMDRIENPEDTAVYENIKTIEDGRGMVKVLISRNHIREKKTAVFVTNDNVAMALVSELSNQGIKVPEEVSVIGFDDVKMAGMCRVPLTTVSQSMQDMGRLAAYDLLDLIEGRKKPEKGRVIDPVLVERDSASTNK